MCYGVCISFVSSRRATADQGCRGKALGIQLVGWDTGPQWYRWLFPLLPQPFCRELVSPGIVEQAVIGTAAAREAIISMFFTRFAAIV